MKHFKDKDKKPTRQQLKSFIVLAKSEIREWENFLIQCNEQIKLLNEKKKFVVKKPFYKVIK